MKAKDKADRAGARAPARDEDTTAAGGMGTEGLEEAAASPEPGNAATGVGADAAARIQALEQEGAEARDRWLRAEAELANYRRRAVRDREEAEQRAKDRVLGEVLALADDLERALDAAEQVEAAGPIQQGIRLVHERVREILRSHGVEVIDPVGRPFDPHVAEALFEVESSGHAPGCVVAVIEKGYRIGERLLRAAKVTVARAPAGGETGGGRGPEDTGAGPR